MNQMAIESKARFWWGTDKQSVILTHVSVRILRSALDIGTHYGIDWPEMPTDDHILITYE